MEENDFDCCAVGSHSLVSDLTPDEEREALASVLHENFNKARGRSGVSPALLADAILAAGFRRVSPVTRRNREIAERLREIAQWYRMDLKSPSRVALFEEAANALESLSVSPPAEVEKRYPALHYPHGESEVFAEGAEWQASRKPETAPSDTCGARAEGGKCVLPRAHNMGRLDVPSNHSSVAPSDTDTVSIGRNLAGYAATALAGSDDNGDKYAASQIRAALANPQPVKVESIKERWDRLKALEEIRAEIVSVRAELAEALESRTGGGDSDE